MIRRLRQHRPCSIRVATPLTFFSTTFSSFSTATTNTTNNSDLSDPDFTDTKTAYGGLSTSKLVRGWAVLKICSIDAIVVNSEYLLATSRKVFGDSFIKFFVHPTFFSHFCAGEGEESIKPTVQWLKSNQIGAILDYAAEADIEEEESSNDHSSTLDKDETHTEATNILLNTNTPLPQHYPTARVYKYSTERECDANHEIFASAIRAVKNVTPEGFAAIKITALGNPLLLERWSSSLVEIRALFHRMDQNGTGMMNFEEFKTAWGEYFVMDAESDKFIVDMFQKFDVTDDGYIDSIEWTTSLKASDTHFLAEKCLNKGSFYESALDQEECGLVDTLMHRAETLVQLAEELDVKVMFDAEHSYFQPAIHNIVLDLQRTYNKGEKARVYNTFQMYLKSSERELERSILLSEREEWHFATKLVRGAYMILERQRADALSYESPIHETIENTHTCYDNGVQRVLERKDVQNGTSKANLLIASHNQSSIERTIELMKTNQIDRVDGGVAFGQLLGMADYLSFSLGNSGYQAYKYLPYGPFYEVLPYLVRRAQENSGLLSGGAYERDLMFTEIKRRVGIGK